MMRTHLTTGLTPCLPVLLALALAGPGFAQDRTQDRTQDRPIGGGMGSGAGSGMGSGAGDARSTDPRAALGDCPAELLRQAWSENPALEAAAVEREVAEFCIDRIERLESLVAWQRRYSEELGILDAAAPAPAQQIDPQPGTTGEADAVAETEPDRAESAGQTTPEPEAVSEAESPPVEQNTASEPTAPAPAPDATAQPLMPSGGAAHGDLPPDRPTHWQVIHAVRAGDGPWDVLFHGTREIAISVPGATPEDPPVIRWQTITEPPVTLAVNEALPDGLVLRAVTDEGVTLGDPIAPEAEPTLIRFAPDTTPGVLEWNVIDLSTATEGGS